jgi:hypothetical protein
MAKKPKKSKKEKTTPEVVGAFQVSLKCGDEVYRGEGPSVVDAFLDLPRRPVVLQKGLLTVSHGEKEIKKYLFPNQVRKVMGYKYTRITWAKLFSPTL